MLFDSRRKRMLPFTASVCPKISCAEVYNVLDQRQHNAVYLSRLLSLSSVQQLHCLTLVCQFLMARKLELSVQVYCRIWLHSSVKVGLSPTTPHTQTSMGKLLAYHLHQQVHTRVYQDSFSSPSFLNASLRDASVVPRPENCTVMPCGRNREPDLRL